MGPLSALNARFESLDSFGTWMCILNSVNGIFSDDESTCNCIGWFTYSVKEENMICFVFWAEVFLHQFVSLIAWKMFDWMLQCLLFSCAAASKTNCTCIYALWLCHCLLQLQAVDLPYKARMSSFMALCECEPFQFLLHSAFCCHCSVPCSSTEIKPNCWKSFHVGISFRGQTIAVFGNPKK